MGKAEILQGLHESAAHTGQIEAWEADFKAFQELKENHEDELRRLRSEIYQVASWAVIFQGVILAAVSQASRLTCHLWWSPVALSVADSVAACLAIANKLYNMGEEQEDSKETGGLMAAILEQLDMVEEQGSALNLEVALPRYEIPRDRLPLHCIRRGHLCALLSYHRIHPHLLVLHHRPLPSLPPFGLLSQPRHAFTLLL